MQLSAAQAYAHLDCVCAMDVYRYWRRMGTNSSESRALYMSAPFGKSPHSAHTAVTAFRI